MPPEVGYLARASDQFDVVFDDKTIRMPRDHPELVRELEYLHYDEDMCFKMRCMPYEAKIRNDHTSTPNHKSLTQLIRDEPNWDKTRLTQMLQMAYEEHGWDHVVDEDSVDDVLLEAGADLSLSDNAERTDDIMKFKFFAEEFGKMQKEGRSQSKDIPQIDRA
ncbi:putative BZIP domain-containing protein [Seiridium cardinale]